MTSPVSTVFDNDQVPVYEFASYRTGVGLDQPFLPDWAVLTIGSVLFALAGGLAGAWLHP